MEVLEILESCKKELYFVFFFFKKEDILKTMIGILFALMLISEILGFEIIAVAIKVEFVARQKKALTVMTIIIIIILQLCHL